MIAEAAVAAPPSRGQLLAAALDLASRGVPVLPAHRLVRREGWPIACSCPRGAECVTPGKHPTLKNWKEKASTDPDVIAGGWAHTPWNVAALVPEGWLVLDTDARNGGPELLAELTAGPELDAAWIDWNGTDAGRHYWLRLPEGYAGPRPGKLRGSNGAEADLLWAGHSVIAAPSAHRAGGNRAWLSLPPGAPPEAPAWLLEAIAAEARNRAPATSGGGAAALPAEASKLLAQLGPREYDAAVIVSACSGEWLPGGLEAMIRCPSHDDRNPSAKLTISDSGRLLWRCYAGCSQPELTAAIRAIPGALRPRPEAERTKPAPHTEHKPGRVYRHRTDLRAVFVAALKGADPSLLPANPPGSDWAAGYGSQYGPEDRPELWAAAVAECSLYARGARADCEPGAGRTYFAGYIRCRFKLCPVCSGPRLMSKAHEHDRGWKAGGVELFDLYQLEGEAAAPGVALKAANAALTAWRKTGAGARLAGASVLRTLRLEGALVRPLLTIAVPAGTAIEGWKAGAAQLLEVGAGFDQVHEHQLAAWAAMLDQVHDTASMERLLAALRARCRLLEPLGLPRTAARKAEAAEAKAEGVTVPELRKARKIRAKGEPCPFGCGRRHAISMHRYRYSDGHDEGGVWVLGEPRPEYLDNEPPPATPPPVADPPLMFRNHAGELVRMF